MALSNHAERFTERAVRVAYVYAGKAPVFGRRGASVHMQEVMRALSRRGAEVDLIARLFGHDPLPGLEAVGRHELDEGSGAGDDLNARVRATLEALGPRDLVYERFSLGSYAAMEHARAAGSVGVLEVNGPRVEKAAARGAIEDRAVAEEAASRSVAAASAVVAVSEAVAGYVREKYGAGDRVHVVPNGVDPERFPQRLVEDRRARTDAFTVGFVGTFKAHHGLDTLIEAFGLLARNHPDAELLLVGDGPERDAVEIELERRSLADRAALTGAAPPSEIPSLLARMDAAVAPYPTRRHYVSPLKVFEYMAAGLPVVGSGAAQIVELAGGGELGLLVAPDDPAALAGALDRLALDPDLRARLGAQGRARVFSSHTWDAVAERILAFPSVPAGARG